MLTLTHVASLAPLTAARCVLRSPAGWEAHEGEVDGGARREYRVGSRRVQVDVSRGQAWSTPIDDGWTFAPPVGELVTTALLEGRALELHASAVVSDTGACWALAGPSGVGKSTISALWAQLPGWRRLAEERLLLWAREGGWHAQAAPWPLNVARSGGVFALRGIVLLAHGTQLRVAPVASARALSAILRCTFFLSGSRVSLEATAAQAAALGGAVAVRSAALAPTLADVDALRALLTGHAPGNGAGRGV